MTSQKLRKTSSKSEIVNLITTASSETKSAAWQIVDGKRVMFPVMGFHLIPEEKKGILHGLFEKKSPDLSLPMNVALDNLSKSFQVTIMSINGNEAEVTMPKEVVTTEFRSGERIYLPHSEHYSAVIAEKNPIEGQAEKFFKVVLRDISTGGLGLIIPQGTFLNSGDNKEVVLLQLGDIELPTPLDGRTVHIHEQVKTVGSISVSTKKVGVELEQGLSPATIKQLIQEVSEKIKKESDSSDLF